MNLVVSTSLRIDSNSRVLAREAYRILREHSLPADFVDLRDHALPLCDAGDSYQHPAVANLASQISRADSLVVATAIHNYDGNAALKNLIELTGGAWEGKAVGFLCAAGGQASYMSIMSLASSLMLDFRCLVVPRFVYATSEAFKGGKIAVTEVAARTAELAVTTASLGEWASRQRGKIAA